jgi:hypothetical protein
MKRFATDATPSPWRWRWLGAAGSVIVPRLVGGVAQCFSGPVDAVLDHLNEGYRHG